MEIESKFKREPKILKVLEYPSELLNTVSESITTSIPNDQDLQNLLDDMVMTLQSYRAAGLAAVQIGVPIRALVIQTDSEVLKVINPVIKETEGESYEKEGCLSFPLLFVRVKRPKEVVVEYFNEKGELKNTVSDGWVGRAIQHETDHLDGKTFLDRLQPYHKKEALGKFKLLQRKFKR